MALSTHAVLACVDRDLDEGYLEPADSYLCFIRVVVLAEEDRLPSPLSPRMHNFYFITSD